MTTLSSYIGNQWYSGETSGVQLVNPVTGETVANACTQGVPIEQAFQIARCDGWTHLQKMTFAERGALLAKMSKAIHGVRESLIEIGRLNGGNTRGDAKFDIDGATGTLMYYAKLGQKLGDRRTLIDGESITIGGARLQPAHPYDKAGGCGSYKCIQLSRVGACRESGVCIVGWDACHCQTCDLHSLDDVGSNASRRRRRDLAYRCTGPDLWFSARTP